MKQKKNDETYYETLIAKDIIEDNAEDAIKFAIEEKKVNNIAITGPYSSGKSSTIQSYFNKNINKKKYLNISLATFEVSKGEKEKRNEKNESDEDEENIAKNSKIESNLIEKIIIEKLYYSSLKKIKFKKEKKQIALVLLIMFSIIFIKMDFFYNIIQNSGWKKVIPIFIVAVGLLVFIIISFLIDIRQMKLKVGNIELEGEIGVDKEKDINLLNKNIDFIVKIMDIAKYRYIIFEDIDRFENTKILERLRDLNITLNSVLKYKVKFIYAIRDDMFITNDRTKFFDFIIPVVPYVSYGNSGEILLKIIKDHKLDTELSEKFLLNISLYVSDIRILKNTVNEYLIYKKIIGNIKLNYEKLFAILLYKNVCPKDFADLQNKKGEVYKCFESKEKYIKGITNDIEIKKNEYKEIEKNLISKNNFAMFSLLMIKEELKNKSNIHLIKDNGEQDTIDNLINKIKEGKEEEVEGFIFGDEVKIKHNGLAKPLKLLDFYEHNCPGFYKQYKILKEEIEDRKATIASEIRKLQQEINNAKEYKLSEVIKLKKQNFEIKLDIYSELIVYLLRNGYIDETYDAYINRFHEGSITEKDYNFIMNIKNEKDNDYKEKLINSKKILERLEYSELKNEAVLNVYLLDSMLESKDNDKKINIYFNTLINSSKYIEIITYYISQGLRNKEKVVKKICNLDKNILKKLMEDKTQNIDIVLEFIVVILNIEELKGLKEIDEAKKYIERNNLLKDKKTEDIKEKIEGLDIKFYDISKFKENTELYNYIVNNNRYQINYANILSILINKVEGENKNLENRIRKQNYNYISRNKKLKDYIDTNIQIYIEQVYKLLDEQENPSEVVLQLLNNENIEKKSKYEVIKKETNKITNLSDVQDDGLWKKVFEENLIEINWNNINQYYEKFKLDDILIKTLNNENSSLMILEKNAKLEDVSKLGLIRDLLLSNDVSDELYDWIIANSECKLSEKKINELEENRLSKLINDKRIEFNSEMLKEIRNTSMNILIAFIRKNYKEIYEEIDSNNLVFNLEEIEGIIASNLSVKIKEICIEMVNEHETEDFSESLSQNISTVIVKKEFKDKLSKQNLLKVISKLKDIELKIRVINLNFATITRENVKDFLEQLGEEYKNIIIDKKRPTINKNDPNVLLLENIKKLEYNIQYEIVGNIIKLKGTNR